MATRSTVPRPTRTPRTPRPSEVRGPLPPELVLASQIVDRLERLREHVLKDRSEGRPEPTVGSIISGDRGTALVSRGDDPVRAASSLDVIVGRTRTHNSRLVSIIARLRDIRSRQIGSGPSAASKPGGPETSGKPGLIYEAFDALNEQDSFLDAIGTELEALEAV